MIFLELWSCMKTNVNLLTIYIIICNNIYIILYIIIIVQYTSILSVLL